MDGSGGDERLVVGKGLEAAFQDGWRLFAQTLHRLCRGWHQLRSQAGGDAGAGGRVRLRQVDPGAHPAQAVSGAQQVVEKLQQHSTEIKNKHELLDSVAAEATQKILNDVINPIQKDLLETLPALEKAAVVAVQLEKFTQGLDGLIKQLNLSNQQYSQGLNKTENEINQKISQAEKKLDQLQHSLILQMETLQSQLEQQVNANVQTVQEAHSALKTNSIQNAASLMTKMETFGERLNTSVNTQLSQQEQKLEKRLTLQQNCIWGMLALLVFILLVK